MKSITFEYGSTVYWEHEAYTVIAGEGLNKVKLKHKKYENVVTVHISELLNEANAEKLSSAELNSAVFSNNFYVS